MNRVQNSQLTFFGGVLLCLLFPFAALSQPMSGTYTVGGTSPDYTSFGLAVSDLSSKGVNGAVVFNVRTGTYTEQINIPAITGSSSGNTITFQSESGNASDVTLQFSASAAGANYVIGLTGATHIRILKMTLVSSGVGTSYRNVIRINGTSSAVSDIIISGNTFDGYNGSSSSADLSLVYAVSNSVLSDVSILNNTFDHGSYGIILYGNGSPAAGGTVVKGNVVSNGTGYGGIYLNGHQAPMVDSNTVNCVTNGIELNGCSNTGGIPQLVVQRNRVVVSGNGYGIQVNNSSANASYSGLVANNFITGTGNGSYGLQVANSSYVNVYYNSINMLGSGTGTIAFYPSGGTGMNVRNNIFMSPGGGYAYYAASPGGIATTDFNVLFTTGPNLAYWSGNQASLAALQSASGKDVNSFDYSVVFVSSTDLHITGSSLGISWLVGTPIAEVTEDIDGDIRSAVTPYRGADEAPVPLAVGDNSSTTRNGLEVAPLEYQLLQNYPNPFNPTTEIKFSVAASGRTTIDLFDVLGARVAALFDAVTEPGVYYRITLDGSSLASGAYFYVLKSEGHTFVKRMLLLK